MPRDKSFNDSVRLNSNMEKSKANLFGSNIQLSRNIQCKLNVTMHNALTGRVIVAFLFVIQNTITLARALGQIHVAVKLQWVQVTQLAQPPVVSYKCD